MHLADGPSEPMGVVGLHTEDLERVFQKVEWVGANDFLDVMR